MSHTLAKARKKAGTPIMTVQSLASSTPLGFFVHYDLFYYYQ